MTETVPARPSAWTLTTDQILQQLSDALGKHPDVAADFPGLKDLLDDYLDDKIDLHRIEFHRRLLRVFRDAPHDDTYQGLLGKLEEPERERVARFVDGGEGVEECGLGFEHTMSLGVREHIREMLGRDAVRIGKEGPVHVAGLSSEELKEKDGVFHQFVHGLASLFKCVHFFAVREMLHPDEVIVSSPSELGSEGMLTP